MQVLKDRILIEKIKKENSNSVLDIPESEDGPFTGLVLNVGKSVEDIKQNDKILYRDTDALPVTLEGKNLLILREYDIIAIL